jgi:hypothetical protein
MKSLKCMTALALIVGYCTGCTYPGVNAPDRSATNTAIVYGRYDTQTENAVISQRTLYPYHFSPDSPKLAKIGDRDLGILARHFKEVSEPFFVITDRIMTVEVDVDCSTGEVLESSKTMLEEAAAVLLENPTAEILIETDGVFCGTWELRMDLAGMWEESVREFMSSRGIEGRIRVLREEDSGVLGRRLMVLGGGILGKARFLLAEVEDFPSEPHSQILNVCRGDASEELYADRVRMVLASLKSGGVDTANVIITDGLPGGEGLPSYDAWQRLESFSEEEKATYEATGTGGT